MSSRTDNVGIYCMGDTACACMRFQFYYNYERIISILKYCMISCMSSAIAFVYTLYFFLYSFMLMVLPSYFAHEVQFTKKEELPASTYRHN